MPVYTDSRIDYAELRLGGTIRELRKRRGWTLQDLASRLSISLANLSAIENDKTVLDTERLAAIAAALEVRPEALFPKNASRHFHVVRKADLEAGPASPLYLLDRGSRKISAHHNRLKPLADAFVGKHIEPFYAEILPVPDDELQFISHHFEEFFFVVRGKIGYLTQTPEGMARETLSPGDCIYFRSNLPHCVRSVNGASSYTIHVLHSPYGTVDSELGDSAVFLKRAATMDLTENIVDQLITLREARGMSIGEFARELGINVRQLADIERGRKPMPLDTLMQACRRFRKPLEYFLAYSRLDGLPYFVQRAGEIRKTPVRTRRRLVDAGWSETQFRSLASGYGPRGMYPYYVKLRNPGSNYNISLHEHHGQEFAYVLNGEVTLITILNGERVTETLVAGDTCFIDSTVPHRFLGMGLSPYDESSAEIIDVYWCPLGESYLFEDDKSRDRKYSEEGAAADGLDSPNNASEGRNRTDC